MAKLALIGTGTNARPVPAKLAPIVRTCLAESGTTLVSGLRTQKAVNFARKRGAVLSSQAELYYGYVAGRPGYNPANPPGRSTHERRSDGAAYAGPVGRPLPWWACGLDIGGPGSPQQNAEAFCRAARKHGWVATITYPSNPRELHHVNFRQLPRRPLNLRKGSRGRKVKLFSKRLRFMRRKNGSLPYLARAPKTVMDAEMVLAVKQFQRAYGLTSDGVIGPQTAAQITQEFRRQWKNRAKGTKKPKRNVPKHPRGVPAACVDLVAFHEGFYSCPYNDPVGHATIGYGHLIHLGPVTEADRRRWGCLTQTQAKALLRKDLAATAAEVRRLVTVPLNRRQFSALVSFAFNCGTGALAGSQLLAKLNTGNYAAVPKELNRWVYGGGHVLPGLVSRRRKEGELFRPLKKPNPLKWRYL